MFWMVTSFKVASCRIYFREGVEVEGRQKTYSKNSNDSYSRVLVVEKKDLLMQGIKLT